MIRPAYAHGRHQTVCVPRPSAARDAVHAVHWHQEVPVAPNPWNQASTRRALSIELIDGCRHERLERPAPEDRYGIGRQAWPRRMANVTRSTPSATNATLISITSCLVMRFVGSSAKTL